VGSIRNRIIATVVLFSLLATLTAGGFSFVFIRKRIRENTFEYLTESAKVYGNEMNTLTASIEYTVDSLSRSIVGVMDKEKIDDPDYFYELSEKLENIADQFDRNSINAMSVYVRFDPRISYSTAGFFHADTNGDGILERQMPTDLAQYEPSDREHVGWFYEPIEAGEPIWMNPYYNANINIEMLSYIAPITIDGKSIGVVGVDVNFERFKDIVAEGPKVGKAVLLNSDYDFLVHDIFESTDNLSTIDNGKLAFLQETMEMENNGSGTYQLFGIDKVLGFTRLKNGWTVVVAMTEEEAFANLNKTIDVLMLLNLGAVAIMVFIAYFIGRSLNKMVLRNYELEQIVSERTEQITKTNEYLKESMVELEDKQTELITLNEQLEDSLIQLRETQEQLIISEKLASLGELVAGVAHEINTPLGIGVTLNSFIKEKIHGLKDRFDEQALTKKEVKEYIDSTIEASDLSVRNLQRAADIVETFKQVAVDQSTLDIRKVKLCDYIGKILTNLSPKLKKTGHKVNFECDETIEVITYPGVIAQILTNLVINSIVHGFDGIEKGEIHISVSHQNDLIRMTYKDNGVGIPDKNIDRVFNPFFSTKHNKGSSGLGLHLVHNLVTQTLEGTVHLSSSEQSGVEFRIAFSETLFDNQ